jgi:hypothetical protein
MREHGDIGPNYATEISGDASRKERWRSKGDGYSAANLEGVEVTRRGFDAQHMTGGGGRPVLRASQWMERTAELQDPEV